VPPLYENHVDGQEKREKCLQTGNAPDLPPPPGGAVTQVHRRKKKMTGEGARRPGQKYFTRKKTATERRESGGYSHSLKDERFGFLLGKGWRGCVRRVPNRAQRKL